MLKWNDKFAAEVPPIKSFDAWLFNHQAVCCSLSNANANVNANLKTIMVILLECFLYDDFHGYYNITIYYRYGITMSTDCPIVAQPINYQFSGLRITICWLRFADKDLQMKTFVRSHVFLAAFPLMEEWCDNMR